MPPKKHGLYSRNYICQDFSNKILIRRYYCPYCGNTFSYLPSFCLPYFQYSIGLIFMAILYFFTLTGRRRDFKTYQINV
uniref:DUF6431 domain-containing protein n=1 Tax=Desulforadius tongensis TaxID=1216062 RepID=UPI003B75D314